MAAVKSFVVEERDVEPVEPEGDTTSIRVTFDAANGCERLEQRVIRFRPGLSAARSLDGRQEVLYVVEGEGGLLLGDERHELAPETGVFLAAGEQYAVENRGPADLVVLSVMTAGKPVDGEGRKVTVRYADQPELPASTERTYRYVINEDAGCVDITQFVGLVQPSKAPMHSHPYDEVGYIIEGEGFAHIGGLSTPLKAGSCFHLPPDEVHCIENSGEGVMRILGVFYPSGSPASRAYEDNK